jgi:predicted nucleotidyltransferase
VEKRIAQILGELRAGLELLYGPRLGGVILFGSQARKEADPDSDIDVLILLPSPIDSWSEIQRTGPLVSALSLRHNVVISCVFDTPSNLQASDDAFHTRVRHEGVEV